MKLLVFDAIYIPGYGMGPFITPIEITDPILLAEVRRKARVKVIEDRKVSRKKSDNNTYPITIGREAEKIAHEVKEEVIEEEVPVQEEVSQEVIVDTPEVQEEIPAIEEPVQEEVIVEEEVSEPVLITEDDLKDETVAELKARLDAMGVTYLYKDGKNTLIKKIIENQ